MLTRISISIWSGIQSQAILFLNFRWLHWHEHATLFNSASFKRANEDGKITLHEKIIRKTCENCCNAGCQKPLSKFFDQETTAVPRFNVPWSAGCRIERGPRRFLRDTELCAGILTWKLRYFFATSSNKNRAFSLSAGKTGLFADLAQWFMILARIPAASHGDTFKWYDIALQFVVFLVASSYGMG